MSNKLLLWTTAVAAATVLPLLLCASASDSGTEILGLRIGMTAEAVKAECIKNSIAVTEIDAETFSVPRPPTSLDGVTETRLMFEQGKLKKIVVLFAIPPPEPTATTLIQRYNQEKERLTGLFGPPRQDTIEMKASNPSERHEWLTRGRAYFQATWKIPDQTKISLWLYGDDAGIVFMEIYEGL